MRTSPFQIILIVSLFFQMACSDDSQTVDAGTTEPDTADSANDTTADLAADSNQDEGDLNLEDSGADTHDSGALEVNEDTPSADLEADLVSDLEADLVFSDLSTDTTATDISTPDSTDTIDAGPICLDDVTDLCVMRDPINTSVPWLRIGTGLMTYEALEEECLPVPVIIGFQGCYHIWAGLETGGFPIEGDSAVLFAEFDVLQGGVVVAVEHTLIEIDRVVEGEDRYQYSAGTIILIDCPELEPEDIADCPAYMNVRLKNGEEDDAEGPLPSEMSDSVIVVPFCCEF
jgi:hypothetical protein